MKNPIATAVSFARFMAGDMPLRRKTLGILTLLAAASLFAGATFLAPGLEGNPWFFVAYWLACVWLVVTLVLLAVYDILQVFLAARRERRALEQSLKSTENSSTKSPSSNTSPHP